MWLDNWWKLRRDKCIFLKPKYTPDLSQVYPYPYWPFLTTRNSNKKKSNKKKEGNSGDYILQFYVNRTKQQMIYNYSKIVYFTNKFIVVWANVTIGPSKYTRPLNFSMIVDLSKLFKIWDFVNFDQIA